MIDNKRCDEAYEYLYKYFYDLVKNHDLNFFEASHIITMLQEKLKENNINAYLIDTIEKYSKSANKKEDCYK